MFTNTMKQLMATSTGLFKSGLRLLKGELMKKLLMILTLSSLIFSLVACNTVQGLGKDIERSATWTKEKLP